MKAEYDENLNFIVMTGGANEWHIKAEYLSGAEAIKPEVNQIRKLEGKRGDEAHGKMTLLEPEGIEGFERASMSDCTTMTAFIDYCYHNYPSDLYDIILWNHGGGPAYGFGMDFRDKDIHLMPLSQNVKAFSDSSLIKDGKKFEIIDYDACTMSSVEIAAALADYADYLVISPEVEPGRGQEYTTWLNAVKNDPSMNGFELGRIIVDAMMEFYTNGAGKGQDATLSVIDVRNFRERLLPSLNALDDLLISEAKTVGSRNNRYNFYDELYSLSESYSYSLGMDSLYDLGNLAGAISVPQSEMNNITQAQINRSENVYTHTAPDILSVLRDNDNSGDDVIYAREKK